ncbi:MAG: hypothetical protein EOM50_21350, partial [Erysipelotrichia bacterium]|nr:hypothetical protein [Erysipelotrichia bacterium]
MEQEDSIHDFSGLKALLQKLGYKIGPTEAYKPLNIVDVDINEIKNLEFGDDGICFVDSVTGLKHQVFLYKRNYHLEKYGKPRFHIRKCETIQQFIDRGSFKAEYRRANTETVTVCD